MGGSPLVTYYARLPQQKRNGLVFSPKSLLLLSRVVNHWKYRIREEDIDVS